MEAHRRKNDGKQPGCHKSRLRLLPLDQNSAALKFFTDMHVQSLSHEGLGCHSMHSQCLTGQDCDHDPCIQRIQGVEAAEAMNCLQNWRTKGS